MAVTLRPLGGLLRLGVVDGLRAVCYLELRVMMLASSEIVVVSRKTG
jgi:hypothetical protein